MIYVGKEEIDNYRSLNPFEYSVPVDGIFKMHIMASDGKNTFMWPNAAYQKIDPPTITIPNSVEGSMEKSDDSTQETSDIMDFNTAHVFSYHDVVKVVKGNYSGYYAVITEPSDLSMLRDDDEVEINYLKMSFQKWIVNENDLDSRELSELIHVRADIDGRSRYTIYE